MFNFQSKTNEIFSFFSEFNSEKRMYNTDGLKNISVDGSGITPSVTEAVASGIKDFIKILFSVENGKLKVLDLGSGLGYLQKIFDNDSFFEAYSFEGASELCDEMVCDRSKVVICDLSKEIIDERLNKAFHLTTSFEFMEHVHRTHQKNVWKNVRYLSNFHLCSIHVANKENEEHHTIISPEEWENFFVQNNMIFYKLGEFPVSKDKSKEPFRRFTGIEWSCSVIYLLKIKT